MWRPDGWENHFYTEASELIKVMKSLTSPGYLDQIHIVGQAYEDGADAMHKADVEWLLQRIRYDEKLGYLFSMGEKEWQEFIR